MKRPKFDSIYSEPWEWDANAGVGIHMIGVPRDRGAFWGAITLAGCPLDLAHRLADTMFAQGEHKTTVLSNLDFDLLALNLKECGVTLEIVAPHRHLPA